LFQLFYVIYSCTFFLCSFFSECSQGKSPTKRNTGKKSVAQKSNLCGSLLLSPAFLSPPFPLSLVDGWGHSVTLVCVCVSVCKCACVVCVCVGKHKQQLRSNNGQSCISAVTVFRTGNAFDACLKYCAQKSSPLDFSPQAFPLVFAPFPFFVVNLPGQWFCCRSFEAFSAFRRSLAKNQFSSHLSEHLMFSLRGLENCTRKWFLI